MPYKQSAKVREQKRIYLRNWRAKNPEKVRAAAKRANDKAYGDPEKRKAILAQHKIHNKLPEVRERIRKSNLAYYYRKKAEREGKE